MFPTKVVEKVKTHILYSINCSRKSCRLGGSVEKYGRVGQVTDDNIIRSLRLACWVTTLKIFTACCFCAAILVT